MLLHIIRDMLAKIVEDIDAGNSHIPEFQQHEILDYLTKLHNPEDKLSKYQAIKYLNDNGIKISRASFDNYVKEGKLPKPKHESGFKENFWNKADFKDFIDKKKNSNELLK